MRDLIFLFAVADFILFTVIVYILGFKTGREEAYRKMLMGIIKAGDGEETNL